MKKSLIMLGTLAGLTIVGSIFLAPNAFELKETRATLDDTSYTTYYLAAYCDGMSESDYWGLNSAIQVRFSDRNDDFSSGTLYEMTRIHKYNYYCLYRVTLPTSSVETYIQFGRWSQPGSSGALHNSFSANAGTKDAANYFKLTDWNEGEQIEHILSYVSAGYNTRRVWFKTTCDWWWNDGSLPSVWASNGSTGSRYLATMHYNNSDSTNYWYVDVPSDYTYFQFQRTDAAIKEKNNNVTTYHQFDNQKLHGILTFAGESVVPSLVDGGTYDQYFVNAYVEGYSSCLASNVNGYLAYPDMNSYVISKFSSWNAGTLSDVTQNDYSYGDYNDDGGSYYANAVRDSNGSVTCQEKISQILANYNSSQTVGNIVANQPTYESIAPIAAVGSIGAFAAGGFFLLKKKRVF